MTLGIPSTPWLTPVRSSPQCAGHSRVAGTPASRTPTSTSASTRAAPAATRTRRSPTSPSPTRTSAAPTPARTVTQARPVAAGCTSAAHWTSPKSASGTKAPRRRSRRRSASVRTSTGRRAGSRASGARVQAGALTYRLRAQAPPWADVALDEVVARAAGDLEHRAPAGQGAGHDEHPLAPGALRQRRAARGRRGGRPRTAPGRGATRGRPARGPAPARAGPGARGAPSTRRGSRRGRTGAGRPGSSSAQPPRLARWTESDAAARTAASRSSSASGARGSSTTSGSVSPSARSRRSMSSPPRASAGQKMREAGTPSRCGRRPSRSTSAAKVGRPRRVAAPAPPSAVRGLRTGSRRGRTSTSSGPPVTTVRETRPNGSRTTTRGGASTLRPRRPKRAWMSMTAPSRPVGSGAGCGSRSSRSSPAGSPTPPGRTRSESSTGCSSSTRRASTARVTCTPRAPATTHATAPAASARKAAPGT